MADSAVAFFYCYDVGFCHCALLSRLCYDVSLFCRSDVLTSYRFDECCFVGAVLTRVVLPRAVMPRCRIEHTENFESFNNFVRKLFGRK